MMIHFRIRDHLPVSIAVGATLGDKHLRLLLAQVPIDVLANPTVLIDFQGLEAATASYLKAFVVRLLGSNQLGLDPKEAAPDAIRFFIFTANMNEDIVEDLNAALASANHPCLEALDWDGTTVKKARLHGPMEQTIVRAFDKLLTLGGGTAADIRDKDKSIGVTGWHYRLNTLHKLGLARRAKKGRSWLYQPIVSEVING